MTAKHTHITGWDIGGAHIKAARCTHDGKLIQLIELACPLWRGIDHLKQAIVQIQSELNNYDDLAAVTMTAELVDIFPDRQTGVSEILTTISEFFPPDKTLVYASDSGWLPPHLARENWPAVASQNWHASASYAALHVNNGLFIDIGSTTCDIIPFKQGTVSSIGHSDFERQMSRELLYTGAIRTPLIALAHSAPFEGKDVGLAAELFATTADCWCLLRNLDPELIKDDSADGQPWQDIYCQQRIARLLGTDSKQHDTQHWLQLAQWFADQQVNLISSAISKVLLAHPYLESNMPIIGAGIGRFIVQKCADSLGRDYIDFSSLVTPPLTTAGDHAPAAAVALLASRRLT